MKIIISTTNEAKINGVKKSFSDVFDNCEFIAEKFESNIKDQPLSEVEGINGAINRAKNAIQKYRDADYFVGLEGYVDTTEYGMFLAGASAVIDKNNTIGIGLSLKLQLPEFIRKRIENGEELGIIIKELKNDEDNIIRNTEGTMGVLTNGRLLRSEELEKATMCALARFITPELYNKK